MARDDETAWHEVVWEGEVVGVFSPNFVDNLRHLGNWRGANTPASRRFLKAVEESMARGLAAAPAVTMGDGRWLATWLFRSPADPASDSADGNIEIVLAWLFSDARLDRD
jgi:hypothetical protein